MQVPICYPASTIVPRNISGCPLNHLIETANSAQQIRSYLDVISLGKEHVLTGIVWTFLSVIDDFRGRMSAEVGPPEYYKLLRADSWSMSIVLVLFRLSRV
jgi:hypothetical protein